MKLVKSVLMLPVVITKMLIRLIWNAIKSLLQITLEMIQFVLVMIWIGVIKLLYLMFGLLILVEGVIGFGWGAIVILCWIFKWVDFATLPPDEFWREFVFLPLGALVAIPVTIYVGRTIMWALDFQEGLFLWVKYYVSVGYHKMINSFRRENKSITEGE